MTATDEDAFYPPNQSSEVKIRPLDQRLVNESASQISPQFSQNNVSAGQLDMMEQIESATEAQQKEA